MTAHKLCSELRKRGIRVRDTAPSAGSTPPRRSRTPFCVTVDVQTSAMSSRRHGKVTIRDRDNMQQIRVPLTSVTLSGRVMDGAGGGS